MKMLPAPHTHAINCFAQMCEQQCKTLLSQLDDAHSAQCYKRALSTLQQDVGDAVAATFEGILQSEASIRGQSYTGFTSLKPETVLSYYQSQMNDAFKHAGAMFLAHPKAAAEIALAWLTLQQQFFGISGYLQCLRDASGTAQITQRFGIYTPHRANSVAAEVRADKPNRHTFNAYELFELRAYVMLLPSWLLELDFAALDSEILLKWVITLLMHPQPRLIQHTTDSVFSHDALDASSLDDSYVSLLRKVFAEVASRNDVDPLQILPVIQASRPVTITDPYLRPHRVGPSLTGELSGNVSGEVAIYYKKLSLLLEICIAQNAQIPLQPIHKYAFVLSALHMIDEWSGDDNQLFGQWLIALSADDRAKLLLDFADHLRSSLITLQHTKPMLNGHVDNGQALATVATLDLHCTQQFGKLLHQLQLAPNTYFAGDDLSLESVAHLINSFADLPVTRNFFILALTPPVKACVDNESGRNNLPVILSLLNSRHGLQFLSDILGESIFGLVDSFPILRALLNNVHLATALLSVKNTVMMRLCDACTHAFTQLSDDALAECLKSINKRFAEYVLMDKSIRNRILEMPNLVIICMSRQFSGVQWLNVMAYVPWRLDTLTAGYLELTDIKVKQVMLALLPRVAERLCKDKTDTHKIDLLIAALTRAQNQPDMDWYQALIKANIKLIEALTVNDAIRLIQMHPHAIILNLLSHHFAYPEHLKQLLRIKTTDIRITNKTFQLLHQLCQNDMLVDKLSELPFAFIIAVLLSQPSFAVEVARKLLPKAVLHHLAEGREVIQGQLAKLIDKFSNSTPLFQLIYTDQIFPPLISFHSFKQLMLVNAADKATGENHFDEISFKVDVLKSSENIAKFTQDELLQLLSEPNFSQRTCCNVLVVMLIVNATHNAQHHPSNGLHQSEHYAPSFIQSLLLQVPPEKRPMIYSGAIEWLSLVCKFGEKWSLLKSVDVQQAQIEKMASHRVCDVLRTFMTANDALQLCVSDALDMVNYQFWVKQILSRQTYFTVEFMIAFCNMPVVVDIARINLIFTAFADKIANASPTLPFTDYEGRFIEDGMPVIEGDAKRLKVLSKADYANLIARLKIARSVSMVNHIMQCIEHGQVTFSRIKRYVKPYLRSTDTHFGILSDAYRLPVARFLMQTEHRLNVDEYIKLYDITPPLSLDVLIALRPTYFRGEDALFILRKLNLLDATLRDDLINVVVKCVAFESCTTLVKYMNDFHFSYQGYTDQILAEKGISAPPTRYQGKMSKSDILNAPEKQSKQLAALCHLQPDISEKISVLLCRKLEKDSHINMAKITLDTWHGFRDLLKQYHHVLDMNAPFIVQDEKTIYIDKSSLELLERLQTKLREIVHERQANKGFVFSRTLTEFFEAKSQKMVPIALNRDEKQMLRSVFQPIAERAIQTHSTSAKRYTFHV